MNTPEKIVAQTQKWINEVVIGLNFCPFAAKEVKHNRVRYEVLQTMETEACLHSVLEACKLLDVDATVETTLLILPQGFEHFETYLDLVGDAELLLRQHRYEGIYQIASFHPEYLFADTDEDDPANYTNRSPYAMLHLLREDSVEKAIARHPHHEAIPEINMELARQKGLAFMKALQESTKDIPL